MQNLEKSMGNTKETSKVGFTAPKISSFICPTGKTQAFLWDAKTPALGVRATASSAKSFIFETWFNGKSLRMTIGDVSTWSIPKAQQEARRLKVLTDQGIDPREERAQINAQAIARQVKGVSALLVWDEYLKDRKSKWGERHLADHLYMVREGGGAITRGLRAGQPKTKKDGILRVVLDRPLGEINREVVGTWIKKESPYRPARVRLGLALLKAFIAWAGEHPKYKDVVNAGACQRLTRELLAMQSKDDCLEKSQLEIWFGEVNKLSSPVIKSYLQILLLTGARRNELATMKWADVDFQWHTATIRDKVEGIRKIPLTPYVELLLNQLPRVNQYVFSSPTAKSKHITEPRIAHNQALDAGGLHSLTLHGLRRSFVTLAEWVECPAGITAQIMGQKPSAIAEKHYIKRPVDLLRQWHTKIEKFILDEAGIPQPRENAKRLRVVNKK
jgi:integrase